MADGKTRGNFDELKQIQSRWQQESDSINQMNSNLASCMQTLEGGDWIGDGSKAFLQEMNSQVMPSLRRLQKALASAAKQTGTIAKEIKNAETESSNLLNGNVLF